MPRPKDPWKSPKDESWIAVDKKVIPLPPDKVFGGADWVCRGLPANPTPYDMPVFIIYRIRVTGNGVKYVDIHLEGDPKVEASRWSGDIKQKWRPAPKPKVERRKREKKPDPIPPTRFEREDVI
jgi:hypothetical protein